MLNSNPDNFQYLFLGGIMGEILSLPFVGNYLRENESILEEMGINDYRSITLNSFHSADKNALALKEILLKQSTLCSKPIIIIGHSKACIEMILCLKDNLELFTDCVHKMICVQPPFLGSSLMEESLISGPLEIFWPGLKCLTKSHYASCYESHLTNNQEILSYLKERLLVVKGHKEFSKEVSWIIKPSHYLMKLKGLKSDGLVVLCDQTLPMAEYKEILMDMDHSDLFTSTLLSKKSKEFRRETMKTLIDWATNEEPHSDIPANILASLDRSESFEAL